MPLKLLNLLTELIYRGAHYNKTVSIGNKPLNKMAKHEIVQKKFTREFLPICV